MIHKGKRPRGMTAAQLSIIVILALVAAAVLSIDASSDYTGESPGQIVTEAFLVDPDAQPQEDQENA